MGGTLSQREHAQKRADFLRAQAEKFKSSGDERELEYAADLETEAQEIDHYLGLEDIDNARESA